MKLVEIKDVRVGQVRKITIMDFHAENTKEVIGVFTRANDSDYDMFDWIAEYYDAETKISLGDYEDWTFEDCGELIGKLNITHEIKNNKLVEILTKINDKTIYSVNDVVKYQDEDGNIFSAVIIHKDISPIYNYYQAINTLGCIVEISDNLDDQDNLEPDEYTYFPIEKLGTYGVTHEFVNDREVSHEE